MKCVHILALKNFLIVFQNYKGNFYKIIGKITLNYYLMVHLFYGLIYTWNLKPTTSIYFERVNILKDSFIVTSKSLQNQCVFKRNGRVFERLRVYFRPFKSDFYRIKENRNSIGRKLTQHPTRDFICSNPMTYLFIPCWKICNHNTKRQIM